MTFIKTSSILLFLVILSAFSAVSAAERETPIVKAVARVRQAVVNIRTEQIVRRNNTPFGFGDSFFEQFFKNLLPSANMTNQSLGSGVIILIACAIISKNPLLGYRIIAGTCGLLSVVFVIRLLKTHAFMPSGILLALSLVALILSITQLK